MPQIIDLAVFLLLGILYGCGMGGGGLLVVYLTLVREMPQGDAQALNLFFYIVSTLSSAFLLLKKKRSTHRSSFCAPFPPFPEHIPEVSSEKRSPSPSCKRFSASCW